MISDCVKREIRIREQQQLLRYEMELDEAGRDYLYQQLENLDWSLLDVWKNRTEEAVRGKIEPQGALRLNQIKEKKGQYEKTGLDAIRQGKVGAVLLAGGQGTRFGLDKPKGTLQVGIHKDLCIFQCLVNNLLDVVQQSETWVPLMIMTSEKNYDDTVEAFTENHFFGYNKDFVFFFIQDMAPSVDYQGKIYLEEKGRISMSPNGNGGWFTSLARCGLLGKIKQMGVEWLNIFSVDNVLQRIADPVFVGATVAEGYVSGAKVVSKASPEEKVGVLCLEDGKPSIVEYYEMTDDMLHLREADGTLSYNYGVILNYLFRIDELEKIMNESLPYHVVEKKIPYLNEAGVQIKPDEVNGWKFELLVLDMIHMLPNCLSYEVDRRREFAPVKNRTGVDSLVTARELLSENGVEL